MKPRVLLAVLAALLMVAGTAPAHATPPEHVVSITLVLRPQTPGAPTQTYSADGVRVGPGPELRGACGGECVDYAHPTVDIDLLAGTISVMVPGSEHQLTDAELLVTTDLITGVGDLGSARERSADSRRAELTPDGVRLTWTSYTGFAPATVVFRIETDLEDRSEGPATPSPRPIAFSGSAPGDLPADGAPAPATEVLQDASGTVPSAPGPASGAPAGAASPVVAEPTFAG